MGLKNILSPRKTAILQNWFDRIVSAYPGEYQTFLKSQADPFANPVGCTLREGMGRIYDALLGGSDLRALRPMLEEIMKIRIVQEPSSDDVLSILPALRELLEEEARPLQKTHGEELRKVYAGVDLLNEWSLEASRECRERISRIKAGEKNRSDAVFERMKTFYERRGRIDPEQKPEFKPPIQS